MKPNERSLEFIATFHTVAIFSFLEPVSGGTCSKKDGPKGRESERESLGDLRLGDRVKACGYSKHPARRFVCGRECRDRQSKELIARPLSSFPWACRRKLELTSTMFIARERKIGPLYPW